MLICSISSSIISPSLISSNANSLSVIFMTTTPGLPQYGSLVICGLTILIFLKEVLLVSKQWNKYLDDSFTLAIVPLFFSLIGIIIYKFVKII